jgi:hypothetical protein
MGLFSKTSQYPGDGAAVPAATSSGGWRQTITALTEKLAAAEAELGTVEQERDAAALSLAMADEETAVARLREYADRIARLRLSGDNTKSAITLAQQRLEEEETREARELAAQRIAALQQLLEQYLGAVQGVDDALGRLAAAFRTAKEVFDRVHDLQTPAERTRTYMMRNSFGPTSAACHYGLNSFLDLNFAQYRGNYQSLSDFAKRYAFVDVSESEAYPGVVN